MHMWSGGWVSKIQISDRLTMRLNARAKRKGGGAKEGRGLEA